MSEIIIACKTLQRELELALEHIVEEYQIIWIESGLHNTPKKLTLRLQEEFNKISKDCNRVLLCFGTCGNSVVGLKTGEFELVIPRVDDCITLLLGSLEKRIEVSKEKVTYFLTKGWLDGERNLWAEYQYSIDKYGKEEADELFDFMLASYKRLGILDTGAYNIEEVLKDSEIIASTFKLELEKLEASIEYIEELLLGPWDKKRFIIMKPNSEITTDDTLLWM